MARTPSVSFKTSYFGYLLVLSVVPGPLWRGQLDLKCILALHVRGRRRLVIKGDGVSITAMVMLWTRKQKMEKEKEAISLLLQLSSRNWGKTGTGGGRIVTIPTLREAAVPKGPVTAYHPLSGTRQVPTGQRCALE